ncbi:MAG: PhnA domain-containing protein [Hyphomicrobiaceae bacterium]|nr:PhnA domain-containing protein [Hyphomicrobiaceae bacterium]
MSIEDELRQRAEHKCELCSASDKLGVFTVPSSSGESASQSLLICSTCTEQIEHPDKMDVHHWRCLNDSMWTPEPAVQVMAWRLLTRLCANEGWARDLLDQLYMEDDVLAWAKTGMETADEAEIIHKDANGAVLCAGDTITLVKDLPVKGAGFTAKRGTPVRNISLVFGNAEHIEGRVSGQQIVILTKFVKKSA